MSRRRPALCGALVLPGLLLAAACGGPEPDPQNPASVAVHLFALAGREPAFEELAATFDAKTLEAWQGPLLDNLDALSRLGASEPPEVLGVDRVPGTPEAYVDLAAELPGRGRADCSVLLRSTGETGWRIVWFQGPGIEWPPRSRRDAGLTTSAPPGAPPGP